MVKDMFTSGTSLESGHLAGEDALGHLRWGRAFKFSLIN